MDENAPNTIDEDERVEAYIQDGRDQVKKGGDSVQEGIATENYEATLRVGSQEEIEEAKAKLDDARGGGTPFPTDEA